MEEEEVTLMEYLEAMEQRWEDMWIEHESKKALS
jgi:hypothetical protein